MALTVHLNLRHPVADLKTSMVLTVHWTLRRPRLIYRHTVYGIDCSFNPSPPCGWFTDIYSIDCSLNPSPSAADLQTYRICIDCSFNPLPPCGWFTDIYGIDCSLILSPSCGWFTDIYGIGSSLTLCRHAADLQTYMYRLFT
jgi:hypothetical protein